MFVIRHKRIFFGISLTLVALSVISMGVFGLPFGIDFTGGSLLEVSYPEGRPAVEELHTRLDTLPIGNYSLRPTGENGYITRTRFLEEEERQVLINTLSFNGEKTVVEERFNSIGPVIGEELRQKALVAMVIVLVAIILFIAFAFRKVSKPVSSWKYGLIAIVALVHDIVIPTGIFALLGHFMGAEIDALFVTALLAILGYSVNDTIVVFDRVRENLRINHELHKKEPFSEVVGKSLSQTYGRSINTSLTTALVLLTLFLLGGSATHFFSLTLLTGVIAGTYSSIFLASPLLVAINKNKEEKK